MVKKRQIKKELKKSWKWGYIKSLQNAFEKTLFKSLAEGKIYDKRA